MNNSIFAANADVHTITALAGILMSLVVLASIRFHRRKKILGLISWYSLFLLAIYVAGFLPFPGPASASVIERQKLLI